MSTEVLISSKIVGDLLIVSVCKKCNNARCNQELVGPTRPADHGIQLLKSSEILYEQAAANIFHLKVIVFAEMCCLFTTGSVLVVD